MLSHLLTQLLRSFGIFFRTIRAFFTRRVVGLWARLKRLTNFSRQATKVAADSLQSAATIAKKPTARGDYVETRRLFISKKLLLTIVVGVIVLALLLYYVIWPFMLSNFFTAHFYVEDSRVDTWTGRVVVYSDEAKTIPLYEGKLEDGLLQGQGKQYDAEGLLEYEGAFTDGLRNGKGKAYEAGILVYEGDFAADLYEGQGKLYQDDMLLYEGGFAAGERAGEGTEYYADGTIHYKGTFAEGLLDGNGTEYAEDGTKTYEGSFAQGVYSGAGSLYPAEGERIDATFENGEPNGSIQWYKSDKLYYDGEADGLTPSGFGTLYTQSGKIAYTGQMANGTVDGTWLVSLTADEFRAALGECDTVDYNDVSGGFVISSPTIGLSALCSYQTESRDAAVHTVYLSEPRETRFALLLDAQDTAPEDWPTPTVKTRAYTKMDGVNTKSGNYTSETYALEGCRLEILITNDKTVLMSWALTTAMPTSASSDEAKTAAEEQAKLEAFLDSLDQMQSPGAVMQATDNPYYGTTAAENALASCASAQDAADAVDAMLTYWENAEKRASLENNLTRTQELLKDAQQAAASGAGSQDTVNSLQSECNTLQSEINTCITEMSKASMQAKSAGGGDPAQYALSELAVLFDPTTLNTEELALLATAYAQSTSGEETVDSEAITLSLKTALADLASAYSNVQTAIASCEQAVSAASTAAGAYATGNGTKADWYTALNAQSDSQAALYTAISAYTKQVNALNELTGGWVSRTQGWLSDTMGSLYSVPAA